MAIIENRMETKSTLFSPFFNISGSRFTDWKLRSRTASYHQALPYCSVSFSEIIIKAVKV